MCKLRSGKTEVNQIYFDVKGITRFRHIPSFGFNITNDLAEFQGYAKLRFRLGANLPRCRSIFFAYRF